MDGAHPSRALEKNLLSSSSRLWWLSIPWLVLHPSSPYSRSLLWVCLLCGSVLSVYLSLDSGPMDNSGWLSLPKILKLITSTKILISNKVTFTGSRAYDTGILGWWPPFNPFQMLLVITTVRCSLSNNFLIILNIIACVMKRWGILKYT